MMVIQYTAKIAELNAAIAAFATAKALLVSQLKTINPNLPAL